LNEAPGEALDPHTEAHAERGLQNFIVASGIWARASGGTTWGYPGLHCFESTVQRRAFNQVIIDTSASCSDDDLRAAMSRVEASGLRYRFRLRHVIDHEMRPRLEELGLVHGGGLPALAFDGVLPPERATGLRVEPVTGESNLRDHVAIVAEAFGWEADQLGQVFRPALLDEPAWFGWVGYENGDPVAASQLVVGDDTGGLYYVAVLSSHRRKRYGEAITRIAVEAALDQGCNLVTLSASQDGYPVYKALGFHDAGHHVGYTTPNGED